MGKQTELIPMAMCLPVLGGGGRVAPGGGVTGPPLGARVGGEKSGGSASWQELPSVF